MTEEELWCSGNPEKMLSVVRYQASTRQLRLLACACCRQFWHRIRDSSSRNTIKVAESFADGLATSGDLQRARAAIRDVGRSSSRRLIEAVAAVTRDSAWAGAVQTQRELIGHAWKSRGSRQPYTTDVRSAVSEQLASLVSDIFGNPFRPSTIAPEWLTWSNATVPKLGQTIYDDRRYDIMPILGDALEDAGCGDAQILDHCRGPGPHVRGCWVVDLILGKD